MLYGIPPLFLLLQLCVLIVHMPAQATEKQLTIASIDTLNWQINQSFENALRQVYKNAALSIKVVNLPSKRSIHLNRQGTLDGELLRASTVIDDYNFLLPLPTPLMVLRSNFYCLKQKICTSPPRNKYIGVTKGILSHKNYCQELRLNCLYFSDNDQAVNALLNKKVELILMTNFEIYATSMSLNKDITLYYNEASLAPYYLYHYLHIKHKNLVPKLDRELKKLQASGQFEKALNQLSSPYNVEVIRAVN
jgi:hypothetical protein